MSETFGELIRRRRESLGIKSFELARRIQRQPSIISRIETGSYKEVPPVDVLEGFERELKLSQAEMLESLGYRVTGPDAAQYDPALFLMLESIQGWPEFQRELLWLYISAVDNALATVSSVVDAEGPAEPDAERTG